MKKINLINKNGITLIVLVITIIVLLVLAGTSISMLTGENGILNKVMQAKEENKKTSIEEQIEIAVMGSIGNTGNIEYEMLRDNLNKIDNIIGVPDNINENSFPIVVQIEDSYIKITKDGEVEKTQIPPEYRKVEYIECTGTQCIETNISTDTITKIKVETDILFNNNGSDWNNFISSYQYVGNTPNRLQLIIAMSPSNTIRPSGFHSGYSTGYGYQGTVIWNEKVNIEAYAENGKQYLKQNGVTQFSSNYTGTLNTGSTLALFKGKVGKNWSSAPSLCGKLYTCKITIDDVLTIDFVPCYNIQTNEIGLYNKVNGVFYRNVGTGTFLKGNDILV